VTEVAATERVRAVGAAATVEKAVEIAVETTAGSKLEKTRCCRHMGMQTASCRPTTR